TPDASDLDSGTPPAGALTLVMLLPATSTAFLEDSPDQFDVRIRAVSDRLFDILRWALRGRGADAPGPRRVVVRSASSADDPGADTDGGSGLLKTFFLENPTSPAKWVRIPTGWSPGQVVDVV